MVKRAYYVILLLLYIIFNGSLVYSTTEKIIIDKLTSYTINGKNITLIGVSAYLANFKVDGVIGVVERNKSKFINGVKINVSGISINPPKAIIFITVDFVCGDNVCSNQESQTICCKDCGCLSISNICLNNICVQNISQPQATYECYQDIDCSDNDLCTIESCNKDNIPFRCQYPKITACINDDRCCPLTCEDTQDNDCLNIDRCKRNDDCDDSNPCTSEVCEGGPKRCKFEKTEGCVLNNKCVSTGTINFGTYCALNGAWLNKKLDNERCLGDYECYSGICTLKKCGKNSFIFNLFKISTFFAAILTLLLFICYFTLINRKKIDDIK